MSQATLGGVYRNSNLFSNYYLDEKVYALDAWDCDEAAQDAFDALQELYTTEGGTVADYDEDNLRSRWIDEVLEVLGYATLNEASMPEGGGAVDRLLLESDDDALDAAGRQRDGDHAGMYNLGLGILEAKRWGADFSQKFSEGRNYHDASNQIKYYLDKTPGSIRWGILTDGKKWRLYGTKDYETETYYEVDLQELLESGDLEAFKRFFVFFRADALRETGGTTFLDEVWSESETAAEELGEDLQDDVFTALRIVGRGFIEYNDLDIDSDDDAALDELKEQSLVLLYRLMFILYAEGRDLINPDDPDAREAYEDDYSLDTLRQDIHEGLDGTADYEREFSTRSPSMWDRLTRLFDLIDTGNEKLGVPAYNGGLFDPDEHAFLEENDLPNRHLAEAIHRISTTTSETGEVVLADYADLNTRHLGSIYEGLLEHQFRVAPESMAAVREDGAQVWQPADEVTVADAVESVERGDLYVVNDDGERKATGAYYTPDYVVSYIVEETIDPLLDDIREAVDAGTFQSDAAYVQEFMKEVKELKILDPAMGSGHFLTAATRYLTKQVMDEAREREVTVLDESHIRRTLAKECIYGVDINEMAVELAKLSMWLETLAADQPLAFLDHHLKCGNSLVGADIEEIEELESDASAEDSDQSSLAEFGATRRGTMEHLMDVYQEFLAIENEDLEDVKAMERKYAEIENDELRQRLVAMANVRVAEDFGVDVPSGAYERMAGALDDGEEWREVEKQDWFKTAKSTSRDTQAFHWRLEFPESFYTPSGKKRESPGFDAVIGNPPYVKIQNISDIFKKGYENLFESSKGRYDLYSLFIELGNELSAKRTGLIVPNKFFESKAGEALRTYLTDRHVIESIVDFSQYQIFDGVSTYTCLLFLSSDVEVEDETKYTIIREAPERELESIQWNRTELGHEGWRLLSEEEQKVLKKIEEQGKDFTAVAEQIFVGIQTSGDKIFVLTDCEVKDEIIRGYSQASDEQVEIEKEIAHPYVGGDEVSRYGPIETDSYLIYPYTNDGNLLSEDIFSNEYPNAHQYLSNHSESLKSRGGENQIFESWYAHWCPRHPSKFARDKILIPEIVKQGEATYDQSGDIYHSTTVYSPIFKGNYANYDKEVLGILNSDLVWYYILRTGTVLRGGYYRYKTDYIKPISLPINKFEGELRNNVGDIIELTGERNRLNLHLPDYLGTYDDGPTLADLGPIPPEGRADSLITKTEDTAEGLQKLRIADVTVERDGDTLTLSIVPYVKPEDSDEYDGEPNQHGYLTLDPEPAMRFVGLDDAQADLIESFVPYAVDEAGGTAGFRDNATSTISPLDRLEALTLPALADVRDGLETYREQVARAAELDEQIERTDALIDEIVYDLYGLTDEEIAIVEDAVGD
ncbi:Eco57I restriction-modification methylase domain-containing protein [Haloglomus halophilum]|uniref:Eco57I restriction-modification methylase domain-containing protein n=1 Tax=Haloglomus halophilum TaxID=2962672 RepID=UPI0020C9C272|nr:N-6 DNA methylase [Haloglomus halophilum]